MARLARFLIGRTGAFSESPLSIGPCAPVKQTSDHCKAAEFPMKTCWKEDAQAVAGEPQNETVTYEELKVKY